MKDSKDEIVLVDALGDDPKEVHGRIKNMTTSYLNGSLGDARNNNPPPN